MLEILQNYNPTSSITTTCLGRLQRKTSIRNLMYLKFASPYWNFHWEWDFFGQIKRFLEKSRGGFGIVRIANPKSISIPL